MRMSFRARCVAGCVAGICMMYHGSAAAAGFALLEQSGSRLGSAFAGTAALADDPSTLFFNPAGIAHLDGAQAAVAPSFIEITSQFSDQGSVAAFGQPLGGSGGDAGDWNFVPSFYATMPIGDRLAVGVGVNAPFGLKLEYADGWAGRFQALNSEIKTINVNPAIAWRVNDVISIGLGVNYQQIDAELTNAVNYSAVIAQGVQQLVAGGVLSPAAAPGILGATTGLEGGAKVVGDDTAWGYNVGILFNISDATQIGVSYRSSIEYEVEGEARFRAPVTTNVVGTGIIQFVSAPGGQLSNSGASVDLELPDFAIASLRQRLTNRIHLLGDVHWTGWSSVQELRVVRENGTTLSVTPERWEDTMRYALGATFELNPAFTLRAGVAYDETPVPDETRTPRLPDLDRTWLAIGAKWNFSDALLIDAGYAHLFGDEVPLSTAGGNAAANGTLIGEQEANIDIIALQLTYRF